MAVNNPYWFNPGGGAGYVIEDSCRFNDNDSAFLSRTFGSAGNTQKAGFSWWLKRGQITDYASLMHSAGGYEYIRFEPTEKLSIVLNGATSLITTQLFRDPTAWTSVVVSLDSTQSTASDRAKLWINGVRVTAFSTEGYVAQNTVFTELNKAMAHYWFRHNTAIRYFDGYQAETVFIDGTIEPADVGEFDSNGNWVPVDVSELTFGTNGFHLNYAIAPGTGNGAGEDVSGNNNDFTESGLAANDQVTDSPTDDADNDIGNYCVGNPVFGLASAVYANGNLDIDMDDDSAWGTIYASSGKYYYEMDLFAGATNGVVLGIAEDTGFKHAKGGSYAGSGGHADDADAYAFYATSGTAKKVDQSGTTTTYGDAVTIVQNTILQCAVDFDNGLIWFGFNDTWIDGTGGSASSSTVKTDIEAGNSTYAAFTGISGSFAPWFFCANALAVRLNFGANAFDHTPPTGFVPWNTANLPAPAVKDPSGHYNTHIYTGNGSARDIIFGNNTSMDPDLVIIKNRDTTDEWKAVDSVRGATKELNLNSTNVESTDSNGVDDLGVTDGFGLGSGAGGYNDNAEDFVSYNWKANGSGSSNTDGSINTAATSANATAGFSISTYTGTGSAATIGHGLGVAPACVWVKERTNDAGNWHVYHASQASDPQTDYLVLNTTAAPVDDATVWNDTAPTSSVFSIGSHDDVNESSGTYVAYCWAEVPGFSKFGSYIGNGSSTSGPFVSCSFRPSFVLIKRVSAAGSWTLVDIGRDPYNPTDNYFDVDTGGADTDGSANNVVLDMLSNGFKIRKNAGQVNASAATFVFMAFAEHPSGEGVSQARSKQNN